MRIKEVHIDGFKSYSTLVKVGPFDASFNAITGLNGSGKSNILDSICFVLGITNLSYVRAGNLNELVYKSGQAGVTKASVTIFFDNMSKEGSPVGYEKYDEISVCRQIVIGGRNRYLVNGQNVQQNAVTNLFHSIQLNVNNPHFLIMQGRITKVINMKPQETLSMLEESAGTKMYEIKKESALRTLDKKKNKMIEVERILNDEIKPALKKLEKEKKDYMTWSHNNLIIERLGRFITAYDFSNWNSILKGKTVLLENSKKQMAELDDVIQSSSSQIEAQEAHINDLKASSGKTEEHDRCEKLDIQLSKDIRATETKLKSKLKNLEKEKNTRKNAEKVFNDAKSKLEEKEGDVKKIKDEANSTLEKVRVLKEGLNHLQNKLNNINAGMSANSDNNNANSGSGESLQQQVFDLNSKIARYEGEYDDKKKSLIHYETKLLPEKEETKRSLESSSKKGEQEIQKIEKELLKHNQRIQESGYSDEEWYRVEKDKKEKDYQLKKYNEEMYDLHREVDRFQFKCPSHLGGQGNNGFDVSKVKGTVATLFEVKSQFSEYTEALETCAGGRLANVVVDDDQTAKILIKNIKQRKTFIPLKGINSNNVIPEKKLRLAKSKIGNRGFVVRALDCINYEKQLEPAMRYVFGSVFLVDKPDIGKELAFDPELRTKCITIQGDVYDSGGTITGGSSKRNSGQWGPLQQLSYYRQLAKKIQQKGSELEKVLEDYNRLYNLWKKVEIMKRERQIVQNSYDVVKQKLEQTASGRVANEISKMKEIIEEYKQFLANYDTTYEEMKQQRSRLETELRTLHSSREEKEQAIAEEKQKLLVQLKPLEEKEKQFNTKINEKEAVYESVLATFNKLKKSADEDFGILQTLEDEVKQMEEQIEKLKEDKEANGRKLKEYNIALESASQEIKSLSEKLSRFKDDVANKRHEHQKIKSKLDRIENDVKEAKKMVQHFVKEHQWIQKEQEFFGKIGTDFDFVIENQESDSELDEGGDDGEEDGEGDEDDEDGDLIKKEKGGSKKMGVKKEVQDKKQQKKMVSKNVIKNDNHHSDIDSKSGLKNSSYVAKKRKELEQTIDAQKTLSRSVNKKVMSLHDQAEKQFEELTKKRDQVIKDKLTIDNVISELDENKKRALRATYSTVNKYFGGIFSALLPNAQAKLQPPEGMTFLEGLQITVGFRGVWKKSLTELSGGQRSLLSLSLVLALLRYKPAPLYILDEVDAALDLHHTQNIGRMIKDHFPDSQFIVVSLKEGLFQNANVIFRTKFVDGCSTVTRTSEGVGESNLVELEKRRKMKREAKTDFFLEQAERQEMLVEEVEEVDDDEVQEGEGGNYNTNGVPAASQDTTVTIKTGAKKAGNKRQKKKDVLPSASQAESDLNLDFEGGGGSGVVNLNDAEPAPKKTKKNKEKLLVEDDE